jgi:hypothetical protein
MVHAFRLSYGQNDGWSFGYDAETDRDKLASVSEGQGKHFLGAFSRAPWITSSLSQGAVDRRHAGLFGSAEGRRVTAAFQAKGIIGGRAPRTGITPVLDAAMVPFAGLLAALEPIPDPRRRQGRQRRAPALCTARVTDREQRREQRSKESLQVRDLNAFRPCGAAIEDQVGVAAQHRHEHRMGLLQQAL